MRSLSGTPHRIGRRRFVLGALAAGLPMRHALAATAPPGQFRVVVRPWKMNDGPSVGEGMAPRLAELGYVVGKNLTIVEDGLPDPNTDPAALARQLAVIRSGPVHAIVDLCLLANWWRSVIPEAPVVAWGTADPVAEGIAESFMRPGKGITGTTQGHDEVARKQVDYLRRIVPGLSGIAIFAYGRSGEVRTPAIRHEQECYERAVLEAGLRMNAFAPDECVQPRGALPTLRRQGFQAAIYLVPVGKHQIRAHAPVAIEQRIATIGYWWHMSENGLLASYGELREEWFKRLAQQLDRLFRGARVSDMPFVHPSRFHLRLNLKTAAAIGVKVPPDLLVLADDVIA